MNDKAEFGLVMPFWIDTDGYTDRDREMFVCGVEFQMIYERLKLGGPFSQSIHTENSSRVRMMVAKMGRRVSVTPCECDGQSFDGWKNLEAF